MKLLIFYFPDHDEFMAVPITSRSFLKQNKELMRVKMELMILKVQRDFCRALENEEDPKHKFKVCFENIYLLYFLLMLHQRAK